MCTNCFVIYTTFPYLNFFRTPPRVLLILGVEPAGWLEIWEPAHVIPRARAGPHGTIRPKTPSIAEQRP